MRDGVSLCTSRRKLNGKVYEYWQLRYWDPATDKRRIQTLGTKKKLSARRAQRLRQQK